MRAMDERAARFSISSTANSPVEVLRTSVGMARQVVAQYARRGPRGNALDSAPLFSTYSITWDFEFGDDAASLTVALNALCAPARRDTGDSPRFAIQTAGMEMADGTAWRLTNGILNDFQIVIEARGIVKISTAWQFGGMEVQPFQPGFRARSGKKGTGMVAEILIGDTAATVFSGTLAFTRDAKPAGFGLDGGAAWFAGQTTIDLVGRFTVRLPEGERTDAMTDQFSDSVQASFRAGNHLLRIIVPRAEFQTRSRRIVGTGMVEYQVEMLATDTAENPIRIISVGGTKLVPLLPLGCLTIDGLPMTAGGDPLTVDGSNFMNEEIIITVGDIPLIIAATTLTA